jgi:pseudomonalisin
MTNSLSQPEELHAGQQLASNNGSFTLEMFSDGGLGLYRTQVRHTMWTSTSLGQPGGWAVMQGDGNFVAYSAGGVP